VGALRCEGCGGPLGEVAGIVRCPACGLRTDTGGTEVVDDAEVARRASAAVLALYAADRAGRPVDVGLVEAAKTMFGPASDPEGLARIAAAIGRDFEAEHAGAVVLGSPAVAQRLLAGVARAADTVRREGSATLDLPFLVATGSGPLHLARKLDAGALQALRERPVPPPRKRGWWPFS
jgi:hypothetical protein